MKNSNQWKYEGDINKLNSNKACKLNLIDFKGTITLALLISSFLIVLSNLEEFEPPTISTDSYFLDNYNV